MDETGLRNHLVQIYKDDCCTLPVSPLCGKKGDEMELLSIYHRPRMRRVHQKSADLEYFISFYKKLFTQDDESFRNIYVTGESGVGKTSFCQRMSCLWSKRGEHTGDDKVQKDIDFMMNFDFVFYVSLRDTILVDVIDMIVDQYFSAKSDDIRGYIVKLVEKVILQNNCLVILDGLDEWSSGRNVTEKCKLPRRPASENCTYLTTCRSHNIETLRLSQENMDIQVKIKGLSSTKINCFVAQLGIKNPDKFIRDIKQCGLQKQLRIPIITEHLVALWFKHKLTDMSRVLMYCNIVNMLFKNAEKRQIKCPQFAVGAVQVPDILAKLKFVKKCFSLLKKICLLCFRSYFKQGESELVHVFTEEELMSEPYFLSSEEIDYLFKVGILSKNKIIGGFGKREQKLSLLHKSYLEFFAAMFVAFLDLNNTFDNVVSTWTSVQDVVEYENFVRFLAGFSGQRTKLFLENIYRMISSDLISCRKYAMYDLFNHYSPETKSLQSLVRKCLEEVSHSNDPNNFFMLEDFIFGLNNDDNCSDDENESSDDDDDDDKSTDDDDDSSNDESSENDSVDGFSDNVISKEDLLKQLLVLNRSRVKSIYSYDGKYLDEYDQLKTLQYIHIYQVDMDAISKFTDCMLQNVATLQTVCITPTGYTLLPELPYRALQHLTSLSLYCVMMEHTVYSNLLEYLSDNILLEHIHLDNLACRFHDCTMTLNLPKHSKLNSLTLAELNILCNTISNCSLKYMKLMPMSENIVGCYPDILNCVQDSKLECLKVDGNLDYMLDDSTMKALTLVKTLTCIKSLELSQVKLPDDVVLQMHPDVKKVKIDLVSVTMSSQCFHSFIESCVNNSSEKRVNFRSCTIISFDEESRNELSEKQSVFYMAECITQMPTVQIICQATYDFCIECNSKNQ